jgi:hypothetical protein
MRPLTRPLAAAFAVAYLLTGLLGFALHSHAPAEGVSQHIGCSHCSCGHSHGERRKTPEPPASPDESDDCVVCENLAKPPLAVACVELEASGNRAIPAVDVLEPAIPFVTAAVWWSRGPPA